MADGAQIDGTVKNSIIFRNVKIADGAVVENCIVMQGAVVFGGTNLHSVILDKNVLVKDQRSLKGYESYPIFIEKNAIV